MTQEIKSIMNLVTMMNFSNPSLSEKIIQVNQNYARFKLSDKRIVSLKRETFKNVSNSLVLRDKDNKVLVSGLKAISKELEK